MLTDHDIKRIIDAQKEVFYTREDSASKQDFEDLSSDFRQLQTSVDNFAKISTRHDQEITVINHRLDKLENPA